MVIPTYVAMVDGKVNDMVVPGKIERRVPPSRMRYEASHPTETARVDQKLYEELKRLKQDTGARMADILKIGADRARTATDRAYHKGFAEGWQDAENLYAVISRCSVCGEPTGITDDDEKTSAAGHMEANGWATASAMSSSQA